MRTHRSFASLTGSILARKTAIRLAPEVGESAPADCDNPAPDTEPAMVVVQPERLLAAKPEVAGKVVPLIRPDRAPVRPTGLKSMPVRRERPAAFTLRLDPERHLRLRLACTLSGRSAQALVAEAVDRLVAAMPEVESLANRINAESIVRPLWDNKS